MNRVWIITLVSVFLLTSLGCAEEVRRAEWAGRLYPSSPGQLSAMLKDYLDKAEIDEVPSNIVALIAPHAGYIYSGHVAAYAFKAIKDMDLDTIVVVAFNHRKRYDAISVYDRGLFETPLGPLEVDRNLARKLILSHDKIYFNPEAFENEHSGEAMLPFIRYVFKDKKIKIVPLLVGYQTYENAEILGNSLYKVLKDKKNVMILGSTDMSHFHNYDEANKIDDHAIEILKELDPEALFEKAQTKECEFCGRGPVIATMIAAKMLGANSIKILKYANSGDVTSKKDSVVGYLSAAFYKKEGERMLNDSQRKRLLEIARSSMESYARTKKMIDVKEDDPLFNKTLGAFVSLHQNGELRGCIGNIIGTGPLCETIRNLAIESSAADPRFRPVTVSELDAIDLEISVLSELKKIDNPDEIKMGTHGVLVQSGFKSGVLLPQVATETGWSKEEFMSHLCVFKAGLPADAWKQGKIDIFIFTAEVFSEKDLNVKH